MSDDSNETVTIIPSEGAIDSQSSDDAVLQAQLKEVNSIEVTAKKMSNAARYGVVAAIVLVVLLVAFAMFKLLTGSSSSITDSKGCVWDEVSPLKAGSYNQTTGKAYTTKVENGKTYIQRECK